MKGHVMLQGDKMAVLAGPDLEVQEVFQVQRGVKREVLNLGIRLGLDWDRRTVNTFPWLAARATDQEEN